MVNGSYSMVMTLAELKVYAATFGVVNPDGHKGRKETWIAAIIAAGGHKRKSPKAHTHDSRATLVWRHKWRVRDPLYEIGNKSPEGRAAAQDIAVELGAGAGGEGGAGGGAGAEELELLEEREAKVAAEARAVASEARAVAAEASVLAHTRRCKQIYVKLVQEREAKVAAEARADAAEAINRDLLEQIGEGKGGGEERYKKDNEKDGDVASSLAAGFAQLDALNGLGGGDTPTAGNLWQYNTPEDYGEEY